MIMLLECLLALKSFNSERGVKNNKMEAILQRLLQPKPSDTQDLAPTKQIHNHLHQ